MQRRALIKDRAEHFGYDIGRKRGAGADDLVQVVVAFQHHQRAGVGIRELLGRIADRDDGALPDSAQRWVRTAETEKLACPVGALAQAFQRAAQLRLEQHHRRDEGHLQEVVQQPAHGAQFQKIRQRKAHQHEHQPAHQLPGAGFARKQEQLIKCERDDKDIDQIPQAEGAQRADHPAQEFIQRIHAKPPFGGAGLQRSIMATAWAAMPSPAPVKPRCSSVVAFTLTQPTSSPSAAAMFWRISGM